MVTGDELTSRNLIIVRVADRLRRFEGSYLHSPPAPLPPGRYWMEAYRFQWECRACSRTGRAVYADWEYVAGLGLDHVGRKHPMLQRILRETSKGEDCPECGTFGPVGQHFDGRDFSCIREQARRDLMRRNDVD